LGIQVAKRAVKDSNESGKISDEIKSDRKMCKKVIFAASNRIYPLFKARVRIPTLTAYVSYTCADQTRAILLLILKYFITFIMIRKICDCYVPLKMRSCAAFKNLIVISLYRLTWWLGYSPILYGAQ
jgi:hypothetical protein